MILTSLIKIYDTSGLDLRENEHRARAFEIDMKRRIPKLNHSSKPKNADVLFIRASRGIYFDSIVYEFGSVETLK